MTGVSLEGPVTLLPEASLSWICSGIVPTTRHQQPGETFAMAELDDFAAYSRLADSLIERTTKEEIADVARLLALNCGYYQTRFGDVPQDVLLRMVSAENLDSETATLLVAGMQNLVSALAEVTGLADDLVDEPRH